MEKIEGIKILQVDGLGGGMPASAGGAAAGGNLADNVVNSALRYRAQAPLVDTLLKEIGITGGDINKIIEPISQPVPHAAAEKSPDK
jgi:uncharacterized membrane protein YqiK